MTPEQRDVHDEIVSGVRGQLIGPLRAVIHSPDLARRWQGLHRRLFGPRRRLCSAVTRLLRWPRLVRLVVGVLSWTPFLAAPLVRRLQS